MKEIKKVKTKVKDIQERIDKIENQLWLFFVIFAFLIIGITYQSSMNRNKVKSLKDVVTKLKDKVKEGK